MHACLAILMHFRFHTHSIIELLWFELLWFANAAKSTEKRVGCAEVCVRSARAGGELVVGSSSYGEHHRGGKFKRAQIINQNEVE